MKSVKFIPTFFLSLLLPLVIGGLSAYATSAGIRTWYVSLQKPSFNPPNYLFGPVWTFLYILMGISLFLIWTSPPCKNRRNALTIFIIQLTLNFLWSFLFFKFNLIGAALIDIFMIWISILTMIILFLRVNKFAAYLQIPYILWVSFASLLNFAIWILN